MRRLLRPIWSLRWSFLGTLAAAGLSVLSLGMWGYVLYVAAFPVLRFAFPPIWDAKGPWLWPVLVAAGVLWAASFLVAGVLDLVLKARGRGRAFRRIAYIAALWLGAVAAWGFMLMLNAPPDGFRA